MVIKSYPQDVPCVAGSLFACRWLDAGVWDQWYLNFAQIAGRWFGKRQHYANRGFKAHKGFSFVLFFFFWLYITNNYILAQLQGMTLKSGLWYRKQVPQAGMSNCTPQYSEMQLLISAWDTCFCQQSPQIWYRLMNWYKATDNNKNNIAEPGR